MAVDVANDGRYVFYLNFRTIGDGTNFAKSEQNFSFSQLIDDASKYLVSVERFRIPLGSIPMLDAICPAITFNPKGGQPLRTMDMDEIFSMGDFINEMNTDVDLGFSLTASGRGRLDFDFTDYSLQLNPILAQILDMDEIIGLTLAGIDEIIGASPMFDRLDQLFKIQIEAGSGLSAIQQEIIDTNVFQNLLTDFLVPSNFSISTQNTPGAAPAGTYNITYPTREDLEFNSAANRRYIMFRTQTPIQNVSLEVTAIYRDGTRNQIKLLPRSVLEIKLGFWRK